MKRYIFEHLHKYTTKAKHQHWSKLRIPIHSQDYLQPPCDHLLHIDPINLSLRCPLLYLQHHQVIGILKRLCVTQTKLNATQIAFMNDIG